MCVLSGIEVNCASYQNNLLTTLTQRLTDSIADIVTEDLQKCTAHENIGKYQTTVLLSVFVKPVK